MRKKQIDNKLLKDIADKINGGAENKEDNLDLKLPAKIRFRPFNIRLSFDKYEDEDANRPF